jgi:ABC-2 type transport system ATP-binding protein
MRQRLGIAAALLPDPELTVLDEPTNGLDPAGIQDIRRLLRQLAEQGRTVFVSSHQLAELEHICDDLVLLRAGRLLYQGPMRDLLQRSSSELTARPEHHWQLDELSRLVRSEGHMSHLSGDRLTIMAPADCAASINRLAGRNGITLIELSAQTPSLEDVFFGLTKDEDKG